MEYNVINEMIASINESNLAKSRTILINSLLWNENYNIIHKLEGLALENNIFEEDNGEIIVRKENEVLGDYVDKLRTEVMMNFSKKKLELLKSAFKQYHKTEAMKNGCNSSFQTKVFSKEKDNQKEQYNSTKRVLIGACAILGATLLLRFFSKNKDK